MELLIRNKTKDKQYQSYYDKLHTYMAKTLKTLGLADNYCISLTLVGPRKIRSINRDYRGIDKETDVISFSIRDESHNFDYDGEIDLGDIFINVNRITQQAQSYGHSIEREFCFLFVHGLLHCLGYDHQNEADEKEMFALQEKILGARK